MNSKSLWRIRKVKKMNKFIQYDNLYHIYFFDINPIKIVLMIDKDFHHDKVSQIINFLNGQNNFINEGEKKKIHDLLLRNFNNIKVELIGEIIQVDRKDKSNE